MRRVLPLVAVAILLLGVVGVLMVIQATQMAQARAQQIASAPPSLGEFVLRLARTMRLVDERSTADQALAALRAAGIVGSDSMPMGAGLTEGDVVRISRSLNLNLATNDSSRAFSRLQTDTYFEVFGPRIAQGNGGAPERGGLGLRSGTEAHNDHESNPSPADPREPGNSETKGAGARFPF